MDEFKRFNKRIDIGITIVLGIIVTGIVTLAFLLHMLVNHIEEKGLQGVMNKMWCGEQVCKGNMGK